jgi:coenzyme F420-0:L-glutamate ligase / coenzyme F420-1:gamma-L-glutamate ligase
MLCGLGPGRPPRGRGGPLRLFALEGIPEIQSDGHLAQLVAAAAFVQGVGPGDVVAVAQKVVSKDEGRCVVIADVVPGPRARALAALTAKDPALCELILQESARIVRRRGATLICETHHGFVCANAGIDTSNTAPGTAVLLPRDSDRSARRIQSAVSASVGGRVGVIVTDTHGRAFRRGLVNVALGVAGFEAVDDGRGGLDREGRVMVATELAVADEMAAAAGLLMGKADGRPVVVISGVDTSPAPGSVAGLLRRREHDLFR